jgi:hypothetical protein
VNFAPSASARPAISPPAHHARGSLMMRNTCSGLCEIVIVLVKLLMGNLPFMSTTIHAADFLHWP